MYTHTDICPHACTRCCAPAMPIRVQAQSRTPNPGLENGEGHIMRAPSRGNWSA